MLITTFLFIISFCLNSCAGYQKNILHVSVLKQALESYHRAKSTLTFCCLITFVFLTLLLAGGWRASTKPNGADGKNLGEEQEETPQDRGKHQEEIVRAGFQYLQ